jgi:enolase
MPKISSIHARQILDSRGNPTVEVDVELDDGSCGRASVPSGASTGSHEAVELRDKDPQEYLGKGVEHAVEHVNNELAKALINNDPLNQTEIDNEMILRDGTQNLSRLGANAVLGISLAVSKAAAASLNLPYYAYISKLFSEHGGSCDVFCLPTPMFNVLNGGAHTDWESTDIQEFMIVPQKKAVFSEHLRTASEVYHNLEKILDERGYKTTVGDEGGFAPSVKSDEEALQLLIAAIEKAGYEPGKDVSIAIDAAASQFYKDGKYVLKMQGKTLDQDEMVGMWKTWIEKYPIIGLEDGLSEDDWAGWQKMTKAIGDKVQIIGDDLLVTNIDRIKQAVEKKACNSLLMKVNQIGTLTESLQAIVLAKESGWKVLVSHRSGETEDTSIADIVVGTNAGQIKAGAPSRSERLAKYNQLLRIEEELLKK